MVPRHRGRHLNLNVICGLGQATIHRQRHRIRESPAPEAASGPLGAEQGCKRILPLTLVMSRKISILWACTLYLPSIASVYAARSSMR